MRVLLVANRGEIARRILRTAHEMGLRTVAVHTDVDEGAPHVAEADVAIRLGDGSPRSYLDVDALLDAVRRSGADAVHPGYGFLSEDAGFARAVIDAGITWVGPPPDVIAAMGDKVAAKRAAVEAGVPTLPSAPLDGDDPEVWVEAVEAAGVGFPLLVKASAGGGGKGMQIVERPAELAIAVQSARRVAESAFGDPTVFAERWLATARHIEIQVMADDRGGLLHLGERECSIQRRHQKVIEESPSTAVTPDLRERMGAAALDLARHVGYRGAGTVELLLDADGGFWFLEMNTRLQVEHPVTEAVTGLDLVRLQLEVAGGAPLPIAQDAVRFAGHAIEARLYAEDPAAGFLPSPGVIHRWRPGATSGVRYDSGVDDGTVVPPDYDPMLAKVVVHAATRDEAVARLARGLRELEVHGVATNRDLLVALLEHPGFAAGDTTTDFIDRAPDVLDAPLLDGPTRCAHGIAAAFVRRHVRRTTSRWPFAPAGWRNVPAAVDLDPKNCADPSTGTARLVDLRSEVDGCWSVAFELDGITHHARVQLEPGSGSAHVNTAEGQSEWVEEPRFADPATIAGALGSGPIAPLPGTIVSVEVAAGDHVAAGQLLVVVEAMKMEHRIEAPVDSTVDAVLVAPGDRVDAHQLLVRLS